MGPRDHDDYFGGDEPLDVDAADGGLALAPPDAAGGGSAYSWQCSREPVGTGRRCDTEVPGSMDFPQYGDGRCTCGADLTYQPRGRRN
ncbi:hypothetical protein ABTY20_12015 [Streptomyces sp. NPDC126497]|uniref:hypothetical protein n=1 Tax=Streptomyces sp. NPDC126497 TaxID=3155313 RepID=UPI003332B3E8